MRSGGFLTKVDFARAGLRDPTLIRLDIDTKLSPQLATQYIHARRDDKPAALLYLLRVGAVMIVLQPRFGWTLPASSLYSHHVCIMCTGDSFPGPADRGLCGYEAPRGLPP